MSASSKFPAAPPDDLLDLYMPPAAAAMGAAVEETIERLWLAQWTEVDGRRGRCDTHQD